MKSILALAAAFITSLGALAADPPAPATTRSLRLISDAYARIKTEFVTEVDEDKLAEGCVTGMAQALDGHSEFLDAAKSKALQVGGSPAGIGVEFSARDGLLRVVSTFEGSPARRAGLAAGDVLLKIDSTSMAGRRLEEAIERIRGDKGSEVRLVVAREGETTVREFVLKREPVFAPSVTGRIAAPGIGYLNVPPFRETTLEALAKQAKALYAENGGELRGLVLDLRGNTGGLLNVSIGVAAAFLPSGTLVTVTEGRSEDAKLRLHARRSDYIRGGAFTRNPLDDLPAGIKTVPIAILVDGATASGAEIVAAALQDHGRARLVGTQTFGRASIQTIFPMAGESGQRGMLKITTATYATPKGRRFDGTGIKPDLEVAGAAAGGTDPSLERAVAYLAALK